LEHGRLEAQTIKCGIKLQTWCQWSTRRSKHIRRFI